MRHLTCVQACDFTRQKNTIIKPINNRMERNVKSVTPSLQQQCREMRRSVFVWRLPIFPSRRLYTASIFSRFDYIIVIRKYKAAECNRLFILDTLRRVRRKRRKKKKEIKKRAMDKCTHRDSTERNEHKKKSIA